MEELIESAPLNEEIEDLPNSLAEHFKLRSMEYADQNQRQFVKYFALTICCIIFDIASFCITLWRIAIMSKPVLYQYFYRGTQKLYYSLKLSYSYGLMLITSYGPTPQNSLSLVM